MLDRLPYWDAISWHALIVGYVECGQGNEALECNEQMRLEGVVPNVVTFMSILKACGFVRTADVTTWMKSDAKR